MESASKVYFPPPESRGGWRYVTSDKEVRSLAGMDADRLAIVDSAQQFLFGGDSWGIAVIRRGYLAFESYTFNVLAPTRFDIWSGTKSFTGTAWGLLFDDSRAGRLAAGARVDLDTPAYQLIPEGRPLSDPRKQSITVGHLLTMTSGIAGESIGAYGLPTTADLGPFELALGRCSSRYGKSAASLVGEPGTVWDYSDAAFAHLALAFANTTGREMAEVMQERVFAPIGIEGLSWDVQGGSGHLGPHTNAHTGIHISARELARFGYLALHGGNWSGKQVIPEWWQYLATRTSQALNPAYGYAWWTNTAGDRWFGLPRDAFALSGYRANRCYVVPSLDLVVARVGSGPATWDEQLLIGGVVKAVTD
jgi:CubicO group peptidase (beta-lactamase class C family)